MSDRTADAASRHHDRAGDEDPNKAQAPVGGNETAPPETRSVLPKWSSVAQAGAFGAILGGVTSGVTEFARVRQGEISTEEAVETVVKSSAQSAATMAVASVAAHVVRSHPVFGVLALAAAGLGAFLVLGNAKKAPQSARAGAAVDPNGVAAPVEPLHPTKPVQSTASAADPT